MHLYLTFIAATCLLMLIPGPNVALIVANSVSQGIRCGLVTVLGTSSAMVLQLVMTVVGLSALLGVFGRLFEWVRWIGVCYLLYLGLRHWLAEPVELEKMKPRFDSELPFFVRGFIVSLTNPKTLFFYAAFFPQFASKEGNRSMEMCWLALTFLLIALFIDSGWAILAGCLQRVLRINGRTRNRITGGVLVGAGVGLALAHRK